jgi:hypothetical protein
MALRMRAYERKQYVAATLIQAVWKGYHSRYEIIPQLNAFKRGVNFLTTFLRGRIDRTKLRLQRNKAATLIQRLIKGYLVNSSFRFIKCDQTVGATLEDLIE